MRLQVAESGEAERTGVEDLPPIPRTLLMMVLGHHM